MTALNRVILFQMDATDSSYIELSVGPRITPSYSGTEYSYPVRGSGPLNSSPAEEIQYNNRYTEDTSSHNPRTTGNTITRRNMADSKGPLIVIGVIVAIIAILVMILVPISFAGLEYYQYGFKRRKTTGAVDMSKVYGPGGRHAVGPDYEFKTFPADAHFEKFDRVTVFAADRLQVSITCSMQYFLRKHQLPMLHENYDIFYRPVLRSNALDALKGAATSFTTREYIRDREKVEKALFAAVRDRLGGKCCEKDCGTPKGSGPCVPLCTPLNQCEQDYGLFSEVRYFQLRSLDIPDELNQRFLQALVLVEENEKEMLKQQSKIIRKNTDAQVKQVLNEAAEINQNATALSNLIASKAEADSKATVENARSAGLKLLYRELGITDPKQKASFDYLRTLRGSSQLKLTVNYDQLIAGSLK